MDPNFKELILVGEERQKNNVVLEVGTGSYSRPVSTSAARNI